MLDLKASILKRHGQSLPTFSKIVVGVSGGADSMALLHLLKRIVGKERLVVAHLDHDWHDQSQEAALFVQQTAVFNQIPYHGRRLQIDAKHGLEAAGRQARYQFFADVARCEGATAVAVAHHANDQAETVLMHLIRGAGLKGLQGMQPDGILWSSPSFRLLRPLLHISRHDIEVYCSQYKLPFLTDPTNADTVFLRNKIRHQILPQLADINPRVVANLTTLADTVTADYALLSELVIKGWQDCLTEQGEGWLRLNRLAWDKLSLSLRRGLLRTAVSTLMSEQTEIGFQAIEDARLGLERGYFGSLFMLPNKIEALVEAQTILIRKETAVVNAHLPLLSTVHRVQAVHATTISLNEKWNLIIEPVDAPDFDTIFKNQNDWQITIPARFETLILRTRQAGERMQPLGMNGRSRALKKIMIEKRIPATVRDQWPLITCDEHMIWIAGHTLDERAKLTKEETKAIRITIQAKPS